jgi:GT2 family glycosyltransferase
VLVHRRALSVRFPSDLSGSVAHGRPPNAKVTVYGDWPAPCELIDGLFLAARKPALSTTGVTFDTRFAIDFYDMDFCRQARKMALVLGTWPMSLCHESDGVRNSATCLKAYETYLDKWIG